MNNLNKTYFEIHAMNHEDKWVRLGFRLQTEEGAFRGLSIWKRMYDNVKVVKVTKEFLDEPQIK